MARLFVCSVLYRMEPDCLTRFLMAVQAACQEVVSAGRVEQATVVLGDSGSPALAELEIIRDSSWGSVGLVYQDFHANLGHSAGCNALADGVDLRPEDMLIFLNPDALPEMSAFSSLVAALSDGPVGVVDARQIPFEHPKEFDPDSGLQSWASGACLGIRAATFMDVGGFDARYFWSYCNDVDLSWRARLAGVKVVHVPEAVVFHDKRVDARGRVIPTETEEAASSLGHLLLAERYGRPDVGRRMRRWISRHGSVGHRAGLAEYRRLESLGQLPQRLQDAESVATFRGGGYASHRF